MSLNQDMDAHKSQQTGKQHDVTTFTHTLRAQWTKIPPISPQLPLPVFDFLPFASSTAARSLLFSLCGFGVKRPTENLLFPGLPAALFGETDEERSRDC